MSGKESRKMNILWEIVWKGMSKIKNEGERVWNGSSEKEYVGKEKGMKCRKN